MLINTTSPRQKSWLSLPSAVEPLGRVIVRWLHPGQILPISRIIADSADNLGETFGYIRMVADDVFAFARISSQVVKLGLLFTVRQN
ncbi:MAG: hypothetical protein ACI8W8_001129 [Rhodothermales bacterium]|jgi:hypothetical protein